jgi:hypothetical protein
MRPTPWQGQQRIFDRDGPTEKAQRVLAVRISVRIQFRAPAAFGALYREEPCSIGGALAGYVKRRICLNSVTVAEYFANVQNRARSWTAARAWVHRRHRLWHFRLLHRLRDPLVSGAIHDPNHAAFHSCAFMQGSLVEPHALRQPSPSPSVMWFRRRCRRSIGSYVFSRRSFDYSPCRCRAGTLIFFYEQTLCN